MGGVWLGTFISVTGVFVAGYFYIYGNISNNSPNEAQLELFKFALTSVFVGGAAIVYKSISERNEETRKAIQVSNQKYQENLSKELEERVHRRGKLEQFRAKFITWYNETKLIRRELRQKISTDNHKEYFIEYSDYEGLMIDLNEQQLELERFARDVKSNPIFLIGLDKKATIILRDAERFLRAVTKEYENKSLTFTDNKTKIDVPENSKLFKFAVFRYKNDQQEIRSVDMVFFDPLNELFDMLAKLVEQSYS